MTKTKLMAILNVTPDSFYDGGLHFTQNIAIKKGEKLVRQGADLLDIGGESTKPGASHVTEEEELKRVIPVIQALKDKIPIPISIDTQKPSVAKKALEAGASFINDISGFIHPEMQEVAASADVPICVMHMQGTPQTMQVNPSYEDGIISSLIEWFTNRIDSLLKAGVKEDRIFLDPGIGFGKTVADNLQILHSWQKLKTIGFPMVLGLSRKSFMGKILKKSSKDLLAATLAMNSIALAEGVEILRVHDVVEHRDIIDLMAVFTGTDNNL